VFLVILVALHPAGGAQFRKIEVREVTVIRETIDPEIDRLVLRLIGELARDQLGDHRDHRLHEALFSRGRKGRRMLDLQRIQVLEKRFLEWRGEFAQR